MSHWVSEMKEELSTLKSNMRLRAIADYIVLSFSEREQDEILEYLKDPTKKLTIQFMVTDRKERP